MSTSFVRSVTASARIEVEGTVDKRYRDELRAHEHRVDRVPRKIATA